MSKLLLLEGGVAGHMNHLYDNGDLTFGKLKEIFTAASNGEIQGTEKTDGQNLYISYSVKEGKAKAARNKGNIKSGGMDAQALAGKFADRGPLTAAFVDAFATFEKAVQSLDPKTQMEIFGPENDIYYNAEIMDPRTPNVISYDTKTLLIHQVGHGWYDKETGAKDEEKDVSGNVKTLQAALEQMQEVTAQDEYSVQINAIRQLEALDDDIALNDAIQGLDSIMSKAGVDDSNTITEYMITQLMPLVTKIPVDEELQKGILKRLLKIKGAPGLPQLSKGQTPDIKNQISALAKDKNLLPRVIRPLEQIIHEFGVEMLRGLQSAFILDNDKEVKRLQAETAQAIKAIEGSDNDEAHKLLALYMQKLKSAEQYDTATEGFVFDFDGVTYKFTGNFAPANQLLGLFKYGRGKIPPMIKETETSNENELMFEAPSEYDVAVVPGAFKPPHRGHLAMIGEYAKLSKRVVVFMSPLARKLPDGREMTFDMAYTMWDSYLKAAGLNNVKVLESPVNSPVGASFKFVSNEEENPDWAQPGEKVVLASSTKGGDDSRFGDKVQKYAREGVEVFSKAVEVKGDAFVDTRCSGVPEWEAGFKYKDGDKVKFEDQCYKLKEGGALEIDPSLPPSDKINASWWKKFGGPLSASTMRDAIAERDLETFAEYLPKPLRGNAEKLLDKLTPKEQEPVSEMLFRMINEILDEASMSGDVEVGPGSFTKKQKKYAQDGWGGATDASTGNSGEILDDPHDEEGEEVKKQYIRELAGGDSAVITIKSLNVPRNEMPQVKSTDMEDFRGWLSEQDIDSSEEYVGVKELKAIQSEINVQKVNGMLNAKSIKELSSSKPVLITADNYLIDGHHRWFALRVDDQNRNEILAIRAHMPVREFLKLAHDYPKVSYKGTMDESDIIESVLNSILEASSYQNFGGKSQMLKVGNIRIDIEDMDLEPSKHGEERRFRHTRSGGGGHKISKDAIIGAVDRALGLIMNDYANGELENGEAFHIRMKGKSRQVPALNVVGALEMKKGPDTLKIITVMRKDDFKTDNFGDGGQKTYNVGM